MSSQFICTNCEAKVQYERGYPYNLGWIYLQRFNLKLNYGSFCDASNRHFCSIECMLEYIGMILEKSEDIEQVKNVGETNEDEQIMDLNDSEFRRDY